MESDESEQSEDDSNNMAQEEKNEGDEDRVQHSKFELAQEAKRPLTHQNSQSRQGKLHLDNAITFVAFLILFIILFLAIAWVLSAVYAFFQKQRRKEQCKKSITISLTGGHRNQPCEITNVLLASDKQVDPIPQRPFSGSAGTLVFEMESSDSTPEVGNIPTNPPSRKKNQHVLFGMGSSDSIPKASGLDKAEFV